MNNSKATKVDLDSVRERAEATVINLELQNQDIKEHSAKFVEIAKHFETKLDSKEFADYQATVSLYYLFISKLFYY